jgi:hypothetical protein
MEENLKKTVLKSHTRKEYSNTEVQTHVLLVMKYGTETEDVLRYINCNVSGIS